MPLYRLVRCHVKLSDNDTDLSDNDVELSDLYGNLSNIISILLLTVLH